MTFVEIDHAREEAASTNISQKRGKKRKNATIARLNPDLKESVESQEGERGKTSAGKAMELRTGRWTLEEAAYCDKLILLFECGLLPIPNGTKLSEFLSRMLKSKQSRLSKKMKNAKLSTKSYQRTVGYIVDDNVAKEFSSLETDFFASIRCRMERSEIRFHMQKEWREASLSCEARSFLWSSSDSSCYANVLFPNLHVYSSLAGFACRLDKSWTRMLG